MRSSLLTNISTVSVIAIGVLPQTVAAQSQEPVQASGLEDIVVTARKREENLQDVSASVSALSQQEIARRFDSDVADFANSAPNVVIDDI